MPFVCRVCGKEFAWLGNLTHYKGIYTSDRSFLYCMCCKAFSQRNVVSHEVTHTTGKAISRQRRLHRLS